MKIFSQFWQLFDIRVESCNKSFYAQTFLPIPWHVDWLFQPVLRNFCEVEWSSNLALDAMNSYTSEESTGLCSMGLVKRMEWVGPEKIQWRLRTCGRTKPSREFYRTTCSDQEVSDEHLIYVRIFYGFIWCYILWSMMSDWLWNFRIIRLISCLLIQWCVWILFHNIIIF